MTTPPPPEIGDSSAADEESPPIFKMPTVPMVRKLKKRSTGTAVGIDQSSTDDDAAKAEPRRSRRQGGKSSKDKEANAAAVDPFPSALIGGLHEGSRLPPRASGGALEDKDPELLELMSSAKYLTNWVPRIKGEKMVVEGCLLHFESGNPELYTDRWKSTSIVERRDRNVVMTKKCSKYRLI